MVLVEWREKAILLERERTTSKFLGRDKGTTMANLPDEIILDILSRLPVKLLLRFKCVSKSWRSLISDPKFAKTHLYRSTTESNLNHPRLFINSKSLYIADQISSQHDDLDDAATKLDYFPLPPRGAFTVGSCNGLVCMLLDLDNFVLLNPSTREYNYLSHPGQFPKTGVIYTGFGYDSFDDDYKVVKGIYCSSEISCDKRNESMVTVFSLKTNSWKRIQESPSHIVYPFPGPLVNGALHWEALAPSPNCHNLVISFDLAKEKFGEVSLPDDLDHSSLFTLGVLEGCFCVTRNYNEGASVEIWTMREYVVKETWTKLVNLSPLQGIYNYLFPLCGMTDGSILFQINRTKLATYNPKDESLIMMIVLARREEFQVATVVESLVSPQGNTRKKRLECGERMNTTWNKRTWFSQDLLLRLVFSPDVHHFFSRYSATSREHPAFVWKNMREVLCGRI